MRTFNIKTPDKKIVPALQDKIDNLTKPKEENIRCVHEW